MMILSYILILFISKWQSLLSKGTCCKTHNECINAHKKSTTLEIIYSDQKTTLQGVDTIMISNLNSEHAWSYEIDPLLASLFRYIVSLVTRNTVCDRKAASVEKIVVEMFLFENLFCY
jgi:hypothetical protein